MNNQIFTCNSCGTQFKSSDSQRYHMKTEWHRYNLKRRVAHLSPISADDFAEKAQLSELEQAKHQVDEFGFPVLKPLNSVDDVNHSHKHHRKSSKYRGRKIIDELDSEDSADDETEQQRSSSPTLSISSKMSELSVGSQDTNTDYGEDTQSEYGFTTDSNYETSEFDEDESSDEDNKEHSLNYSRINECIFCGVDNKEIEKNVKHMFNKHGLYIPERSYLVNLPGLLEFLIEVIIVEFLCPCCNFQGSSVESIRSHLDSKRHCSMPYETARQRAVFSEFYDYSSLEEQPIKPKISTQQKKSIRFAENSSTSSTSRPQTPNRNTQRPVTATSDRRLAGGITEKQFTKTLKKMQQLEKRAIDEQLRRNVKRMNFQLHYRDELLQ
ncbi:hypothetical protein TBLA_0A08070 [Henningerozyma blattae CBS 6284]|uniref:C2H2-type domain-containing protein n=1 Tax=Henningerozyma blattae (strain ATCC 34711 / CBS 6284 / DSM 70876 / NBRC 10599 / NRRL Y-10934 / UCD 77-7) TaxID=1071380 RepID=I2GWU5_HENB6|nr:hypothetical protein TBLA_0A08070 [Tetrapisispora blattae CBS 6284]CCH58597.1 hypothetical protein TBLA_0A08070 [Tetrapisispora blattae CBS 6284]